MTEGEKQYCADCGTVEIPPESRETECKHCRKCVDFACIATHGKGRNSAAGYSDRVAAQHETQRRTAASILLQTKVLVKNHADEIRGSEDPFQYVMNLLEEVHHRVLRDE